MCHWKEKEHSCYVNFLDLAIFNTNFFDRLSPQHWEKNQSILLNELDLMGSSKVFMFSHISYLKLNHILVVNLESLKMSTEADSQYVLNK